MEAVGYASSLLLTLTLGYQVFRQWRAEDNGGVSPFLYVGQLGTSLGFLVYSVSLGNRVFVVTNALLLVAAGLGIVIHVRNGKAADEERGEG